jgi:hypothetical protein
MIEQSGITTDDKPVFAGMFRHVGTHGTPLEVVLDFCRAHGMVVDWPAYIAGALKDGHKPRTISARILTAVGEVYGPAYREAVGQRIGGYLKEQVA